MPARRHCCSTRPGVHEADELGLRRSEEKAIVAQMFWRPWMTTARTVEGAEHWYDAKAP